MLSSLLFLLFIGTAEAEEVGTFSSVKANEPAPFDGFLFDKYACSDIIIFRETARRECDLHMSHQLGLQANRYKLEIRDLKIDYDSLNDEYKLIRENKDKEILALQEELKKYSSKKPGWWFAAGVAIGVGGTAALAVQLTR
jgi:hypothetical protein|tara:strand:- start:704 stop:1126 length:423 start_codon:yes stop_codon:yes gene_type:complete